MTRFKFTIIFILFSHNLIFAQKFNTEAVDKFWVLVDHLKNDKPLNDTLWNSYNNLVGNKLYMENNRTEYQVLKHRKYLEIIFRPSFKDSLLKASKKEYTEDDILTNLIYIKNNESKLRTFSKVITSQEYLKSCFELAKKYLPKNKYNETPKDLMIYINALTFDAAILSPNIYFGLSTIYESDRFQKGMIAAHEFHHLLRVEKEEEKAISYSDSSSYSIIQQINNEGTADMVDKTISFKNKNNIYLGNELSVWLLKDAEKIISRLDSAFKNNANPTLKFVTIRQFRKITNFSSGHVPGYYMSDVIVRNGFEKELIDHSDNPFNIFYLYNKAAAMDKKKPIRYSNEAMNYL